MHKKSFLTILFVFFIIRIVLAQVSTKNNFTIKATITGLKNGKVKLIDGDKTFTSSYSKTGVFILKGSILTPDIYSITFSNKKSIELFLDNSDITIVGNIDSLQNVKIINAKSDEEYQTLKPLMKEFENFRKEDFTYKPNVSEEEILRKWYIYDSIETKLKKAAYSFMISNKKSSITPYLASIFFNKNFQVLDTIYRDFDFSKTKNTYEKYIKKRLNKMAPIQIGRQTPEIILLDTTGTSFSVSSLKGKFVLIDFWSSWCGPCRKENKNVVELYKIYKSKGLEVVGISLDDVKKDWIKAIKEDNLPWIHISDLKGFKSDIALKYDIDGIPFTFLLDKNGIIIAKELRGEELKKKLAELMP